MKKDWLKILSITIVALFVAILSYPFLHELGQIIASFFVVAEVLELTLFPVPSVLCDVSKVSNNGLIIIGFGGVLLPLIISFLIPRKWFFCWFFRVLLQGMSVLSFAISCVSILFSVNHQDDMIRVLNFWESGKVVLLLILCSATILTLVAIILDRPGRRICKFFGV